MNNYANFNDLVHDFEFYMLEVYSTIGKKIQTKIFYFFKVNNLNSKFYSP